jgi:hypothetical protein
LKKQLPNLIEYLDTREKYLRYHSALWATTMSYYLETMDLIDTNSIHTNATVEECITAEIESIPKSTNRVRALNNEDSENNKEQDSSDHNNNNDGFVSCASKGSFNQFYCYVFGFE